MYLLDLTAKVKFMWQGKVFSPGDTFDEPGLSLFQVIDLGNSGRCIINMTHIPDPLVEPPVQPEGGGEDTAAGGGGEDTAAGGAGGEDTASGGAGGEDTTSGGGGGGGEDTASGGGEDTAAGGGEDTASGGAELEAELAAAAMTAKPKRGSK